MKEEEHITKALQECGYPMWTRKLKEKQLIQRKKIKDKSYEKSRGIVMLPYVQGITKLVKHILKHYDIATVVRPHTNIIKKIPVHPKDKVEDRSNSHCIYQIPCKTFNMSYIGEKG